MLKIITLSAFTLTLPIANTMVKNVNTPADQQPAFYFLPDLKNTKTVADIQQADADLKQSSWFSEVVKKLQQKEYEFSSIEGETGYSTPNRKNNLRFKYSNKGFSVQPRTTKLPVANRDASTQSGETKYTTIPDWNVAFNFEKELTEHGEWHIKENKADYITDKLTVQYINDEAGMRQNFIVNEPLQKEGDLKVHFSISTKLQQRLQGNQLQFIHDKSGVVLQYDQLKVWDATGKPLEAAFTQHNQDYCIHVKSENAVYPITIDPLSSSPATILEFNQPNANVGYAVASADLNGDGYSDIIVGAPNFDNSVTDEGAVNVYYGSATGVSTTLAYSLVRHQANSNMGTSVASADINGDGYSDIIIGSPKYDNGETDEGVVYIYYGSMNGISFPHVMLENNYAGANMGSSVANAGDVNGDGFGDIIIGAPRFSNGETNEGAAFIYYGSASGISAGTAPAAIIESNQANANSGNSVAGAGDVNGDGYSDIIIGASLYSSGETNEGAAFIYHGAATGINTTAAAIVQSNQANANLGCSVSSAGDVNGDGYSDVIVGALHYANEQTNEGAAFVYHGSASGINTTASVMLESNQADALMGASVACAGDINGDGYSDVIIGVYQYDNVETDEGAAFVYNGSATGINATASQIIESNQVGAYFGSAVASAGDVNGDGYSDIIVGARLYDNVETDEGGAYIYLGSASTTSMNAYLFSEGDQTSAGAGTSLTSAGDVNGDGYSDVIVGVPYYTGTQNGEGAAFIYHGSAAGLSTTPNTILRSNLWGAYMGKAVAGAGDVNGDGYADVIVGVPSYENGEVREGAVFLYYGSAAGVNPARVLVMEGNQTNIELGISVASAGDVNGDGFSDIIFGSPYYNSGVPGGAAFVCLGSASGINTTPTQLLSGRGGSMGVSVASAGDVNGDGYGDVIVGAHMYTSGGGSKGAFFVFHGSATGISTTFATMKEGTVNSGYMGYSVSGAGDIDGDGYSDIVVGAYGVSNAAYVYKGSASGIDLASVATLSSGKTNSNMGYSVAGGVDVNGDGYSDVFVGAPSYTNGQTSEGAIFVFHGSPSGIITTPAATTESNVIVVRLGLTVGAAGDVNGDGFGDVLTGNPLFDNGHNDEGGGYIYYGNARSIGNRNNLDLYNNDLSSPVSSSNYSSTTFGAGLFAKSFLGTAKGKLVYETRYNYAPYSGTPITNSVEFTGEHNSYTSLGTTGINLKSIVTKTGAKYTKIRARVKYDLVTALTGQVYGPWRYAPDLLSTTSLGALPVNLISFKAQWLQKGKTAQLKFVTDNESETCCYEIEKSTDGVNWKSIGKVNARNTPGANNYNFVDPNATGTKLYYRLKIRFDNGQHEYSNLQWLQANSAIEVMVFPNPANDVLKLQLNNGYATIQVQIINSAGQTVQQLNNLSTAGQRIYIPVSRLAAGTYFLLLQSGGEKQVLQFVKQ